MNKLYNILAVLIVAVMLLTACAPATQAPAPAVVPPTAEVPKVKVCQVTDTGGIDDKSFNTTAWKGVEDAIKKSR